MRSEVSAAGGDDDQIHKDEHSVVAPAVGARFAPETDVPGKYFLLYGAEHNQNQSDGGELCENARNYSETASELSCTQKNCETLSHPNVLAPLRRILKMFAAAGDEHDANHQAQQQKSN